MTCDFIDNWIIILTETFLFCNVVCKVAQIIWRRLKRWGIYRNRLSLNNPKGVSKLTRFVRLTNNELIRRRDLGFNSHQKDWSGEAVDRSWVPKGIYTKSVIKWVMGSLFTAFIRCINPLFGDLATFLSIVFVLALYQNSVKISNIKLRSWMCIPADTGKITILICILDNTCFPQIDRF